MDTEYELARKAAMKPDEIEGKDYSLIYDYDGNIVKYYHASHRIVKIKLEENSWQLNQKTN